MAEQKKEEIQSTTLFTQRKADVLLERFNMVTTDVEKVQSRGSAVKDLNLRSISVINFDQLGLY